MEKIVISKTETEGRIIVSGSEVDGLARSACEPGAPLGLDAPRGEIATASRVCGPPVRRGWQSRLVWIGLLASLGLLAVLAWHRFAERTNRPEGGLSSAADAAGPAATSESAPAAASTEGNRPPESGAERDSAAAGASQPLSLEALFESFKSRVFVVSDGSRQGSGGLLAQDDEGRLIVTARHVIEEEEAAGAKRVAREVLVAGFDASALRGRVVGWHQTQDLALVWLPGRSGSGRFHQPIVESAKIEVAEPVWTIGHPMGQTFSLSDGRVTRLPQGGLLQFNAPICSGNSGGPLYDLQGNLVGVVSFARDASGGDVAQNLNFAVCADALVATADWHFESVGAAKLAGFAAPHRPRQRRRWRGSNAGTAFTRTKKPSLCQAST